MNGIIKSIYKEFEVICESSDIEFEKAISAYEDRMNFLASYLESDIDALESVSIDAEKEYDLLMESSDNFFTKIKDAIASFFQKIIDFITGKSGENSKLQSKLESIKDKMATASAQDKAKLNNTEATVVDYNAYYKTYTNYINDIVSSLQSLSRKKFSSDEEFKKESEKLYQEIETKYIKLGLNENERWMTKVSLINAYDKYNKGMDPYLKDLNDMKIKSTDAISNIEKLISEQEGSAVKINELRKFVYLTNKSINQSASVFGKIPKTITATIGTIGTVLSIVGTVRDIKSDITIKRRIDKFKDEYQNWDKYHDRNSSVPLTDEQKDLKSKMDALAPQLNKGTSDISIIRDLEDYSKKYWTSVLKGGQYVRNNTPKPADEKEEKKKAKREAKEAKKEAKKNKKEQDKSTNESSSDLYDPLISFSVFE